MTKTRVLSLLALLIIGAVLLGCFALSQASSNPGVQARWLHAPFIGGHMYSVGLVPCTATTPGQILFGRAIMIFSSYPPPGLSIPLTQACP